MHHHVTEFRKDIKKNSRLPKCAVFMRKALCVSVVYVSLVSAPAVHAADISFDLARLPAVQEGVTGFGAPSAATEMSYNIPASFAVGSTAPVIEPAVEASAEAAFAAETASVDGAAVAEPSFASPATSPLLPATAEAAPGQSMRKTWKDVRDLEYIYQALNVVDVIQTVTCLEAGRCHESNPTFGRNPHRTKLVASKMVFGALHYAMTRYLLKNHNEMVDEWMIGSIVLQGGVVMWNMQFCF